MSGGDRIFIELSKKWMKHGYQVHFLLCKEGYYLCKANATKGTYHIISWSSVGRLGVIYSYFLRILEASISLKPIKNGSVVYSSSDFLTDVIPALLMKMRNKNIVWSSGLYLLFPNPFKGRLKISLRNLTYYLSQRVSIFIMKKYADIVFVLNNEDKRYMERCGVISQKVKVISGGVDFEIVKSIKSKHNKAYDACFVGRFHWQKGLLDLIDVWERICKRGSFKLAVIGWGSQEWHDMLEREISRRSLISNIKLLGFLDGEEKFQVLKSSKFFVFPSYLESWGLAVCEAMACGLPVVAYDLPIYRELYKKGIIRVPIGDVDRFTMAVMNLLENRNLCTRLGEEALEVASRYAWDNVADQTLEHFRKALNSLNY